MCLLCLTFIFCCEGKFVHNECCVESLLFCVCTALISWELYYGFPWEGKDFFPVFDQSLCF